MGDLSEHFSRREFRCKCGQCGLDTIDVQTLAVLEHVRRRFKAPVSITSGHRCRDHNRKVGGASRSKHLEGRAADFTVKGHGPKQVLKFIRKTYPDVSCKAYSSKGFVHMDTRTGAPWRP